MIKVKVNFPKDTTELENKAAETIAKILINKLQPKEVDELIEILQDDTTNIRL